MPTGDFDPQAGFLVVTAADFANFNEQTFTDFYQPILGPVAFSLFYALRSQLVTQPTLADRHLQSRLLVQTNTGTNQLLEALHRLEGLGLVQTYFRHDQEGKVYVYELHATMTPEQFINDDLLSVLLLEAVGVEHFDQLAKHARRFQLAERDPQLENISHDFFAEYRIAKQEMVETPTTIVDARQTTFLPARQVKDGQSLDFDWSTLLQLLNGQPVIQHDLEDHRQLIETEHQLYGIDEPTMKRLIVKATNLQSNHFDASKFRRVVASFYKQAPTPQPTTPSQTTSPKNNAQIELTAKDQALLTSAKDYSPIDFLQSLKEQTGGYVTGSERNILQRLIKDGQLAPVVVNILTWYVLVGLDNATLKASLVDAIANSWLRAGVSDGVGALKQLKTFNQGKKQSQKSGKPRRNYQRLQVRETMPKWEHHDKKASPEAIAKAKARLNKKK